MKKNDGMVVILFGFTMFVVSLLLAGASVVNAEIKISYEPQEAWSASTKKDGYKPDIEYWTYMVKSGDTFSSIAAKHLGGTQTWHGLANDLRIKNPDKIFVGQKIRLPYICRVIWDHPDGTIEHGLWNQDCELVQDWADHGNEGFPNLNHRVQREPGNGPHAAVKK